MGGRVTTVFLNTPRGKRCNFSFILYNHLLSRQLRYYESWKLWQLGLFSQTRLQALGGLKEF